MERMIEAYINTFVGYGSESASRWFVGMEEAGVKSLDDFHSRVSAWYGRGASKMEDLADYHHAIGEHRLFPLPCPTGVQPLPPLQRTWAGLLRFDAAFSGTDADTDSIRKVQAVSLGRRGGDTALVELLPLPAASTKHWPYTPLAGSIPWLANRKIYRESILDYRCGLLRSLILAAKPKVVLFYGASYLRYWRMLSEVDLSEKKICRRSIHSGFRNGTAYLVAPHPVARGLTKEFWLSCGQHAAQLSGR